MSLDFDGSTSLIVTPINATLRPTVPLTIAVWIRPDTLKACGIYQTNKDNTTHRGAWLNLNSASGDIDIGYGDNTGNTSTDRRSKTTVSPNFATTGAWQHVAASIRGATDMTIYLNGADVGGNYSGSGGGMAYNTGVAGRIGALAGVASFDGRIADVGFWNVSLSTAEILAMAKGVPASRIRVPSLLVNYPFWNATNPSIDLSPNSLEASTLTAVSLANHCPVGPPAGY